MKLYNHQEELVNNSIAALLQHGNTLGVAPTGAGKTICISALIGRLVEKSPDFKVCVLAHRDELTEQNLHKFTGVNSHISTSVFNATEKSWNGQVTFAMVQTLSRENNLDTMPKLDLLVIDEAHHSTAETYECIMKRARLLNPGTLVFGVTATPMRGDKNSLGKVFTNCGAQINLEDLIQSGHLVKPKTWIIDSGETREKLQALKVKATGDYDEQEVAQILDTEPSNNEVIRHWREKAGDRKTVVFCSTIQHAKNVTEAFKNAGVKAGLVNCKASKKEREAVLNSLKNGEIQVIINVAILIEGWDFPPISCVVLLRACSYKSTMIQMIGRGLRTVNLAIYSDVIKRDCIVLDFGISSILHGSLEQSVDLAIKKKAERHRANEAEEYERSESQPKRILENLTMVQIELIKRSSFPWTVLRAKVTIMIAGGFKSWCLLGEENGLWIVLGGSKQGGGGASSIPTELVYQGKDKLEAIKAADDFLYRFENENTAKIMGDWREMPASEKQLKYLPESYKNDHSITKGDASNYLTFELYAKPQLKKMGVTGI